MDEENIPEGFERARFSPGFLDHGGPYFLKAQADGPSIFGMRVCGHHINYQIAAHGGVIATYADVALSHAIYDLERPRLAPSTINLAVSFLAGTKLGDWLEAYVQIDRIGGRTAYSSGRILCEGTPIATMAGVFAIRRAEPNP